MIYITNNLLKTQLNEKRNDGMKIVDSVTKHLPIKSDEIVWWYKISISNRSATRLISIQMDALGTVKMTNGF